jgi:hypothetical protein
MEVLLFLIPLLMVVICGTTCLVADIKHKQALRGRMGWRLGTYLTGILVSYLDYRWLWDKGFVLPIIMGLILMGFFWFMAMLPLLSLCEEGKGQ